jgi:hypothetical protein
MTAQEEVLIGFLMSQGQTRALAEAKVAKDPKGVQSQMEQQGKKQAAAPDPTEKKGGLDAIRSDREESPLEPGQQEEKKT